ncbi:hypothetical protein HY02_10500 [Peptococcaceae bacterium SCADC1_2_3]|nr:hypothetical protein DK28_0213605 [Peptococcaceae bacterium SCADC1_2_3]KFI34366.1 hypothetical protein HY00_02840 [Peptococcaceae bacterium SCADC1_2_3]KFI36898.1 hypothetical protein HY02_10500 [Peptococcaceae bacterium SCADC1_2_3]
MLRILELLNKSRIVNSYEIQDFRQGSDFYYIKVQVGLHNNTFLYIRQYVSDEEYSYSYHWQDESGLLVIRWDNAPHYKQIQTYPHHKHLGEKILASNEMTLEGVLEYIDTFLEKK